MLMKRSATLLIGFVLAAVAAHAQSVYSAKKGQFSLTVGGEASIFQPDYIGSTNAQSNGLGINYGLVGIGTFADFRFTRWVQLETEARWSQFNINLVQQMSSGTVNYVDEVGENTYLAGPRIPLLRYHKFTPYGKALFGVGRTKINPEFYTTHNNFGGFAMAFGGGVDYKLSKRISVRLFDVEYQSWNLSVNQTNSDGSLVNTWNFPIHPYGASAGVSYRIF